MEPPSCAHHAPCRCQHSHPGALLPGSWQQVSVLLHACCIVLVQPSSDGPCVLLSACCHVHGGAPML